MTKQTVSVHAKPTGRGEMARVVTTVETMDDGGRWNRVDQRTQVAEGRNAVIDYELEDGQRLIVETKTLQRVVMDPNQKAAILAPVGDEDGSQTIAENERRRLEMAEQEKRRAARADDRIDKLMADSKGSPGPGELDKLQEKILQEQREDEKKLARGVTQEELDAEHEKERAKESSSTRPLTQAGGSSPNTAGKVEGNDAKDASGEAKAGSHPALGAKASGTPQAMSGTSADGAKDSKQVK